ncbi:MAG: hypothetical protein NZM09_03275 [Ignavibacterium sp.]|nr:hypothetical protein [Ignavibacterium sp.]MDW8374700.1 hypothetical protein [Ignavibacteriales bacterium]
MPTFSKTRSGEKILKLSETVINNTLNDPTILQKVSEFGYNSEKLNQGKQLLENANEKYEQSLLLSGKQQDLTESVKEAFAIAKQAYQDLSNVAKAVFKNDKGKLAQLGLTSRMPRTIAEFIVSGIALFENIEKSDEIKNKLQEYGYDNAKIKTEKLKIIELQNIDNQQEAAKGEAQNATKEKEKAIKDLYDWTMQYLKIARVALKQNKQLLEKLGTRVYSQKTSKQRGAAKKAAATKKNKKQS